MPKLSLLLTIAALAAVSAASCADTPPPVARPAVAMDSLRALLPAGTFTVDVMDVVDPPRLTELQDRLYASAWYMDAVSRTAGEPPYDAAMGLTEAEHREYLGLWGNPVMSKVAESQLTVQDLGTRVVLNGGEAFPDLTGVVVDFAADQVTTSIGVMRGSTEVHPDSTPLGAWDGRAWGMEEGSRESGHIKVAALSLGRLRENGRSVLIWRMGEVRTGQVVQMRMRAFRFDPPPSASRAGG
ncbi:MAG TPA: hypothetical protein VE871_13930 [Longimicrobium sp.]|nr:hypothetical protein [Longimicrobium sp.]